MLRASAQAWNRGDLARFIDDYVDAPTTTFVGGAGLIRGVETIRSGYQARYFSEGALPDSLTFSNLETRRLGANHVLTIGRYLLTDRDTGESRGSGFFSLVLERRPEGWRIIHDHSSAD